ncbi:MAG TPA: NAD-dependent epimerase/dehydratase family protein [Pyrinomonadaceae bacterium]|jgi:nucleoside-diphosphate-sugar epimerase|nr:NAD-dependent epimerase/dehydratase family protein [Pyrinomonadaceae bacterium]
MSETYFITGAQGCIGSWIVKALIERDDAAVVFDRSDDSRRLNAIVSDEDLGKVRFITGDITDGASVLSALDESGAVNVIHLAGLQVPTCKADPVAGSLVNITGTLNVFEASRKLGLKRVVYASSAAVYGLNDDDIALDETAACEPTTHYGVFKRANEGNARVYYLDHGLNSVGLRPLTVYGVNRDTGLTSDPTKAMKSAVLGRPFHIRFGGATDFQYVADTAAAFIACADSTTDGAHVFNLHGETVTVDRIANFINAQVSSSNRDLITFGGPPIPIAAAMDDSAIRKVIGSLPSTPLEVGVRETMDRFAALREAGRLDISDLNL